MPTERVVLHRKHILLDRDEVILIDTGSPSSFHKDGVIHFGGKVISCPTTCLGVDCDYLSEQLERPIAGLLGMDCLSKFDNVLFDYANNQITLDGDVDYQHLVSLNSGVFMGVPYIELEIDGRSARMFVDTGAPVSYISPKFTSGKNASGTVEDFHPLCGQFTTNTYELSVMVNGNHIAMIFGNLPSLMQMAIGLGGIDGIIGYELFSRNKLMFRQGEFYLIA